MFYFIINPERQKLKLRKAKQHFCKSNSDINAYADADISKRSGETTVNYLGTKIQVQKNCLSIILRIFLGFKWYSHLIYL